MLSPKPQFIWGILLLVVPISLSAQEKPDNPTDVVVRFKIFDTNKPTKQLTPAKRAIVYARDPGTLKAFPLSEPKIKGPDKDLFYEVSIPKGWLIEQLEITIVDGEKDYNPAVITKIVSAANMNVYPGASRSTDEFSFQAYIAQLGTYRALIGQLIEEVDDVEKERRRGVLREEFRDQLKRMAEVEKRLKSATPNEKLTAQKLADEVLELYGLSSPKVPESIPQIYYPLQPYPKPCCFFRFCR